MADEQKARAKGCDSPAWTRGEFRTGPVAGTALVSGVTFTRKGLQYADMEGLAVFEGDIILGTVEEVRAAADAGAGQLPQFAVGITGQQFRWPNCTVAYDIDPSLPNQQRITDAIAHWEANTCIRFVLRTPANAAQHPDWVHFIPGSGCASYVGRRGGSQDLWLGSGCTTGNAIHELGHAIGLWHEQSREDRDTFVRIEWANIDPSAQHNFQQHVTDGDDLGAYDYGSIMHYPANAFSINGQATIVALQPLPPGVAMGQRNSLSHGDIDGVHTMYGCGVKTVPKDPIGDPGTLKEVRKDPIKETLKDVRKDPIRDTLKEVRKDPIQDTFKEMRKDPTFDPGATAKEVAADPIGPVTPGQPFDYWTGASVSPFITGIPSRVPGVEADPVAVAAAQVQELAEALMALEQQHAELLASYNEAVRVLEALAQGQV